MQEKINEPIATTALTSDHLPVVVTISDNIHETWRRRKNFRETDWRLFDATLNENLTPDVPLNSSDDIDAALRGLNTAIEEAVHRAVPVVELRSHLLKLAADTIRFISYKNLVRKRYQRSRDRSLYREFRNLAKLVQTKLEVFRNQQFRDRLRVMPKASHPFWKVTKILRSRPNPFLLLKTMI